ncbi:MAG: ATP-binding protein [Gammaproteobacteria bacterium]|nr:MAG: ATP-binding protein [Gammaproteobacteria bacterium]
MSDPSPQPWRARLARLLAASLDAPIVNSTPRRLHGALALPGKATAVIGMRRAGKTTFLHQMRRERRDSGTPIERLVYLNLEDERLAGLGAEHLRLLPEEYYRRFPELRQRETVTWCFDEIQVVPGWERFVRRLLDSERVEIFVSGSSAALLSREIATAMRGRAWEVLLHPFSFEEYLRHHHLAVPEHPHFLAPRQQSALARALQDYLACGGFPEVQGLDPATRRQVLRDYVDVATLRDIVERHRVSNVIALRWLVRHLLGNAGSLFSVEKFFADLKSQGLRVSKDTVHELLAHVEDCFLARVVWIDAGSERRRMVNPRKIYPVDPGLIPVFDRTGRANIGHALETVVMLELERRRCEVNYVRTGNGLEVDFLARAPDGSEALIQVCADASDPQTLARELRALQEARALYPRARALLLTLVAGELPAGIPSGVEMLPAYEWLLSGTPVLPGTR